MAVVVRKIVMRIAIVGCGYVADYYLKTIPSHPELALLGITDRQGDRVTKFAQFYQIPYSLCQRGRTVSRRSR